MTLQISPHPDTVVAWSHQSLGDTTRNITRGAVLAISMSLAGGVFAQTDAIAKIAQSGVTEAKRGDLSISPMNTYSIELPSGSHINKRVVSGNTPLFYTLTIDTGNIHGIEINIASWVWLVLPDDTSGNKKIEILSDFLWRIIKAHPKLKDLQNIHITTPTTSTFSTFSGKISIPGKMITLAYNPDVIDTGMISISNISLHDQKHISELFEILKYKKNQTTREIILISSWLILMILSGWGGWWMGRRKNKEEAKVPLWVTKTIAKNNTGSGISSEKTITTPPWVMNTTTPKKITPVPSHPDNHKDLRKSTHTNAWSENIIQYSNIIQEKAVNAVTQMIESCNFIVTPSNLPSDYNWSKVQHNLINLMCCCSTQEKTYAVKITEEWDILMKPNKENRLKACKPYTLDQLCTFFKNNQHVDPIPKENPTKQW